jgi:hypothetical protein
MIATPMRRSGGPLYPVNCPVCGTLLGSFYRDGLSLYAYSRSCMPRCEQIWAFAKHRSRWRELPPNIRQLQIAIWMLDHETQKSTVAP